MDPFEEHRAHLHAVATRILGSRAEADDALQEAWIRVSRADAGEVENMGGWLTTIVSRVCLSMLDARRRRREEELDAGRLPDPIVTAPAAAPPDPEGEALAADAVGAALLVVLEELTPAERIAFVLHDIFGYAFDEVAASLQTSPAAARQLASRARKAVEARRPRFPATPEQQRDVVLAFGRAASEGDVDGLMELLHPDVVFTSDGGGVVTAARKPIVGADRVARVTKALTTKGVRAGGRVELVEVNGMPGWMSTAPDGSATVMSFTIDEGRIVAIDVQRNPEKLRRLP